MSYLIAVIIIFIALLILAHSMLRISRKQQENQIALAYMETLESYYLSIQNQLKATREFRHDLARHIQTLEYLMKKEKSADLQNYTDVIKGEYLQLQNQKLCKNEVINAVISIKKSECDEKNIDFESQIEDQKYASIAEIDLVGLLFNLLDNAIEENEKIADTSSRKIYLSMKQQENSILIDVENAVRKGKKVLFQTEKKDKASHGVGLVIVQYLVKKYQGSCHAKADPKKNFFRVSIRLTVSASGEYIK